jgi:predicted cupin superfamily sugar epimerase
MSSRAAGRAELSADDVVRLLGMAPHPEGGHYCETFRDQAAGNGSRSASTAIYFLLREREISSWHRIDAAEVWHWYAGAPLKLSIAEGDSRQEILLGNRLGAGERPQAVVPAGAWQQAASAGSWTLVGCTVAPGFDFSGFELAPAGFSPA